MDLSYIKKIIKLVEHSEIDEIEVEEEGKRIRVAKSRTPAVVAQAPITVATVPAHVPAAAPVVAAEAPVKHPEAAPAAAPKAPPADHKYHEIRSPIVGTFYRSPSPDAEPYVEVGDSVRAGTVLCIVEAMKLMNEIESDVDGKIVQIMVENSKPVEYNQLLFLVEKP